MKITKMSGKLKGMYAINTNTLSNPYCQKMRKVEGSVCSRCYAAEMLSTFRMSCVEAYEKNSNELSSKLMDERDIPFINAAYVRINAFGELINSTHLLNLCMIARKNENTTFALWTKRKELIFKHHMSIPNNIILIYSNPVVNGVPVIPKYFHKVFTVYNSDGNSEINCGGSCAECLMCYKKNTTRVINERLKYRGHAAE